MLRAVIALVLINASNCLFFHLTRNEVKCFIEEMPGDTIFQGKYLVKISGNSPLEFEDTPPGFGMEVQAVYSPTKKVILQKAY